MTFVISKDYEVLSQRFVRNFLRGIRRNKRSNEHHTYKKDDKDDNLHFFSYEPNFTQCGTVNQKIINGVNIFYIMYKQSYISRTPGTWISISSVFRRYCNTVLYGTHTLSPGLLHPRPRSGGRMMKTLEPIQ